MKIERLKERLEAIQKLVEQSNSKDNMNMHERTMGQLLLQAWRCEQIKVKD